MDWDWLDTFEEYFNNPSQGNPAGSSNAGSGAGVNVLLKEAMGMLGQSLADKPNVRYYYSICEMGYLRKFVETNGGTAIEQLHNFLRVVGGGITSPDCLLTSGEGFIRNYLLGKLWLAARFPGTQLAQLKHCWLPDDFGQDPELPVAVKALGMESVSFSRIPGFTPSGSLHDLSLAQTLASKEHGADFFWQASDGSSVFTHWMPGPVPGYYQGSSLFSVQAAPQDQVQQEVVSAIQAFLGYYHQSAYDNLSRPNPKPPFSAAPTPYLYLPLDEDFMYPIASGPSGPYLLEYVEAWNSSGQTNGIYAVEASYEDFVSLVLAWNASNPPKPLLTFPYNGTPYWTGFYASRPELKILHYHTTRLLLTAEVIGLMVKNQLDQSYWTRVLTAWENLSPSSHHDYICGTAPDDVTDFEQITLLQTACNQAEAVVGEALNTLAGHVVPFPGSLVIVNRSGHFFTGLVELPPPVPSGINSIRVLGESLVWPVQPTAEGGLVFPWTQTGLSWSLGGLSSAALSGRPAATVEPATNGADSYTLKNEFMTVTVTAGANWGIASIQDSSGRPLLENEQIGNDLVFYEDYGNIYQFGNEVPTIFSVPSHITFTPGQATVLEQGPVRVRLQTVVSVSVSSGNHPFSNQTYTREYCLAAGEPFLRMTTTGTAPSYFSIMTRFPLAQPVTSIVHGTPCHWTSEQPLNIQGWEPPVFRATQNFVLPYANDGSLLGAIYHGDIPAWSFDGNGNLLGCILRNTPNGGRGASGSDWRQHTLHYALRLPNGLGNAANGQPLTEAMNYTTPALGQIVPSAATGTLNPPGIIAFVSEPGFILAAKPGNVIPGTLILRLYQPTNSPQTLNVTLGRGQPAAVVAVTALEDPIPLEVAPQIRITSNGFTIDTVTALNTVQITFNSQ